MINSNRWAEAASGMTVHTPFRSLADACRAHPLTPGGGGGRFSVDLAPEIALPPSEPVEEWTALEGETAEKMLPLSNRRLAPQVS